LCDNSIVYIYGRANLPAGSIRPSSRKKQVAWTRTWKTTQGGGSSPVAAMNRIMLKKGFTIIEMQKNTKMNWNMIIFPPILDYAKLADFRAKIAVY